MYIKYSFISSAILTILVLIILYRYYKNNKNMLKKMISLFSKKLIAFVSKNYKIIFGGIVGLFFLTRLCLLDSIPFGIHIDEASVGYNAFSIAKYGVDRYLNSYPLYFLNFSNGQSAMYTYLLAILIKMFGYSLFVLRLPSVMFGFITLIFGYLLGKKMVNKNFGLLMALLITICPYFIMASRFALDCNLMLGMFTVCIYSLLKAIEKEDKLSYFVAGLLFGLTLYTYALSYIIIPVCLLFVLLYLIYTKKVKISYAMWFIVPLLILAMPLIVNVLVQLEIIQQVKTSYFSLLKMKSQRASELSFSLASIIDNIKSVPNLLKNDSVYYNAFPKFGTLYLFSKPLVLLGLLVTIKRAFVDIKKREFNKNMYILLLFLGNFISMLFIFHGYFYINHLNSIYIFLVFFLACGMKKVCEYLKKYWFLIIIIYLLAFVYFCYFYFGEYSRIHNLPSFDEGYSLAIKDAYSHSKQVYASEIPAGTLWAANSLQLSPYKYKENADFYSFKFHIPKKLDDRYSYVVKMDDYSKQKFKNYQCKKFEKYYSCYKK